MSSRDRDISKFVHLAFSNKGPLSFEAIDEYVFDDVNFLGAPLLQYQGVSILPLFSHNPF